MSSNLRPQRPSIWEPAKATDSELATTRESALVICIWQRLKVRGVVKLGCGHKGQKGQISSMSRWEVVGMTGTTGGGRTRSWASYVIDKEHIWLSPACPKLGQLLWRLGFGLLDWLPQKLGVRVLFLYIFWSLSTCIFSPWVGRMHERTRESWLVLSEPSKQHQRHWPLSPPPQLLFFSESKLVTSCQLSNP